MTPVPHPGYFPPAGVHLLKVGLVLFALFLQQAAWAQTPLPITPKAFFYPDFTATEGAGIEDLAPVSAARITQVSGDSLVRLTSGPNQAGALWYRTKQKVGDGFETVFDYRVTAQNGEGFAFVLHRDEVRGVDAAGGAGCQLGYGGIDRSLIIEFYTGTPGCGGRSSGDNHVSVQLNGATGSSIASASLANLDDGRGHTVKIRYTRAEGAAMGDLTLFFDDMVRPVLSVQIDLSAELGIRGDQLAWAGFTSGTGLASVSYDILNWFFVEERGVTCLEYDFATGQPDDQNFIPHPYPGGHASWPQNGNGWTSALGEVSISRGIIDERGFLLPEDGFNSAWVSAIRTGQKPILQFVLKYTWQSESGGLPQDSALSAQLELKVPGGTPIIENGSFPLTGGQFVTENGETRRLGIVPVSFANRPRAVDPTGLRILLHSNNTQDVIRLKKAGVCIDVEVPRPPVLPFGARQACSDLQATLMSRNQPFGIISSQPELPSYVTVEPYLRYGLNAAGYPQWLTYDRDWLPAGHAVVPCALMESDGLGGRQLYNPTAPGEPIIRFAAVGTDATLREQLVLLNYAGYFSVGTPKWCHAGDNVFANFWSDRNFPDRYGPGYNVPSPKYRCDTLANVGLSAGPCGSFVGSLFRAMGYYNVRAFAQVNMGDPSSTGGLHNLYYGVDAYVDALPDNLYMSVERPLVRTDLSSPRYYRTVSIRHEGLRVYPKTLDGGHFYGVLHEGRALSPVRCQTALDLCWSTGGCDPDVCEDNPQACAQQMCSAHPTRCSQMEPCGRVRGAADGHWNITELDKVLSPLQSSGSNSPEQLWRSIKPGDIAITLVEGAEIPTGSESAVEGTTPSIIPAAYTHIQIVVGWGPRASSYSVGDAHQGNRLYPRFGDIPCPAGTPIPECDVLRAEYVPYVMDRFSLPGTGGVTGPRPFSYMLWHTATEFWVAVPE